MEGKFRHGKSEGKVRRGGGPYLPFADAVSRVLPHATQIADRYHLVQNLREHLQRLLDHKRSCLPFVEDTALKGKEANPKVKAASPADLALGANSDPAPGPLPLEQQEVQTCTEADLSCLTYAERKKQMSRDKRVSRYEEVMALHREGLGQRAIARQLRISRNTVQRYVCSPGFPERAEGSGVRASRKTKLDLYLSYLREQWNAGIHNCSRLFDEVKERGYTGCQSGLRKRLVSVEGRAATQTVAGESTQTASLRAKRPAPSFLASSVLSDDCATREIDRQATTTA